MFPAVSYRPGRLQGHLCFLPSRVPAEPPAGWPVRSRLFPARARCLLLWSPAQVRLRFRRSHRYLRFRWSGILSGVPPGVLPGAHPEYLPGAHPEYLPLFSPEFRRASLLLLFRVLSVLTLCLLQGPAVLPGVLPDVLPGSFRGVPLPLLLQEQVPPR